MSTLHAIAAEYKRAVCMVSGDGREWWHPYSTKLVYDFMQAVADEQEQQHQWLSAVSTDLIRIMDQLAELKAELQPEGPIALAASRRQVEVLEARIQGLLSGECPV